MKRKYYGKRTFWDALFDPPERDLNHEMREREEDAIISVALIVCLVVVVAKYLFF